MRPVLAGIMLLIAAGAIGCQTSRGIHTIPVSRDYDELPSASIQAAREAVAEAHAAGAQESAPFEYYSAFYYLEWAEQQARQLDRLGKQDYAALATSYAEAALRKTAGDAPVYMRPASEEACHALFEELRGEYLDIDPAKASSVSPAVYAHATAAMSLAEQELLAGHWQRAAESLALAKADLYALQTADKDGDGIVDLHDLMPWVAEDQDGLEDADGRPDLDNDQDGIPDSVDVMPNDPETRNRWRDEDGAPDAYPELTPIHFSSGSATLGSGDQGYLRGVAILLKEWPELKLHVAGYTDDVHSVRYNIQLSQRRAKAVSDYLVEQGVASEQLVVTFHGSAAGGQEDSPSNARRVELYFE